MGSEPEERNTRGMNVGRCIKQFKRAMMVVKGSAGYTYLENTPVVQQCVATCEQFDTVVSAGARGGELFMSMLREMSIAELKLAAGLETNSAKKNPTWAMQYLTKHGTFARQCGALDGVKSFANELTSALTAMTTIAFHLRYTGGSKIDGMKRDAVAILEERAREAGVQAGAQASGGVGLLGRLFHI